MLDVGLYQLDQQVAYQRHRYIFLDAKLKNQLVAAFGNFQLAPQRVTAA